MVFLRSDVLYVFNGHYKEILGIKVYSQALFNLYINQDRDYV